jgi:hypothetical protein
VTGVHEALIIERASLAASAAASVHLMDSGEARQMHQDLVAKRQA